MTQLRGTDFVSHRNHRGARRRALLRGLETAISIAFTMTPLTLAAFTAISGA
jgi:hypothetical protein